MEVISEYSKYYFSLLGLTDLAYLSVLLVPFKPNGNWVKDKFLPKFMFSYFLKYALTGDTKKLHILSAGYDDDTNGCPLNLFQKAIGQICNISHANSIVTNFKYVSSY